MISHVGVWLRNIRRFLSRSEWAIRLLRLSRRKEMADKPGLIMVQIDGLSMTQFQRALLKEKMPFLDSLLQKERYILHSMYSGLPSNTPAVQAELFYGVKSCVPAFSFVDRHTQQPIKMFDTSYVMSLEEQLKKQGSGLLEGGSCYSNIYTGGAKEAHFCWAHLGWGGLLHAVNPLVFPFLVLFYIDIFIRTFVLLVVELLIAAIECIRGTIKGRVFLKELEFVWLRVLICVMLREVIVAGVCMDIMRGLPVIHLNFLGYDEQAHCRGPSSRFAHWSLRGIDAAIKHIHHVIKQSPYRQYDLWVYSDHGQEKTDPYFIKYGMTVESKIQELLGVVDTRISTLTGDTSHRASLLRSSPPQATAKKDNIVPVSDVVVTAMGPVGHVYLSHKMDVAHLITMAHKLVKEAHIPVVLMRHESAQVIAVTARGQFVLPQDVGKVFGYDHIFIDEIREDILAICHHPDAGDFIILGWSEGETAISFPLEYGAHAGAGPEETKAFALLPMDVHVLGNGKNYIRAKDLRKAAQNFLAPQEFFRAVHTAQPKVVKKSLCIMSYNVHGCKGMDGFISTDRIARVIARYKPDVVALQELDIGRARSGNVDQVEQIARRLEMSFHFHPAFRHKDGQYGNAILSRSPIALMKKDALPKLWNKRFIEPRGALWAVVEYEGMKINIVNTHLSLWAPERLLQVKRLMSREWLMHPDCQGPVILCGDLNMDPNSTVYKEICKSFQDSQVMLVGHRPTQTWFAGYSFRRIDHIFVTPEFSVQSIQVLHTALDKRASDHLPLIVELGIQQQVTV